MPKLLVSQAALLIACGFSLPAIGQAPAAGSLGSIREWESDSFTLDRSTNTMAFDGFRIVAERWNLSADKASAFADRLNFDAGEWRFEGNIRVTLDSANLAADRAVFQFRDQQLISAELSGNPVEFEDTVAAEDGPVFGTANELRYDNTAGTVELLGTVSLTVGPYRTTGCDLVYFLGEEEFTTGSARCTEPFRTVIVPNDSDQRAETNGTPSSQ